MLKESIRRWKSQTKLLVQLFQVFFNTLAMGNNAENYEESHKTSRIIFMQQRGPVVRDITSREFHSVLINVNAAHHFHIMLF